VACQQEDVIAVRPLLAEVLPDEGGMNYVDVPCLAGRAILPASQFSGRLDPLESGSAA
jgi:hypothetical protein